MGPSFSSLLEFICRELLGSGPFFLGSDLRFGLEPVIEFRAGLIASLDVEFVRSMADAFFEGERLDRAFLCACGGRQNRSPGKRPPR